MFYFGKCDCNLISVQMNVTNKVMMPLGNSVHLNRRQSLAFYGFYLRNTSGEQICFNDKGSKGSPV